MGSQARLPCQRCALPAGPCERTTGICCALKGVELQGHGTLLDWLGIFKTLQAAEVWASHGEWIQEHQPEFGPGVRERFDMASQITREDVSVALRQRDRYTRRPALQVHVATC